MVEFWAMRTLIWTILLVTTSGFNLNAQFTVKTYREFKDSRNNEIKTGMTSYIAGMGHAYMVANAHLNSQNNPMLFCQPDKLSLDVDNFVNILDIEIGDESKFLTESQLQSTPIALLLLRGLEKTFPCSKGR